MGQLFSSCLKACSLRDLIVGVRCVMCGHLWSPCWRGYQTQSRYSLADVGSSGIPNAIYAAASSNRRRKIGRLRSQSRNVPSASQPKRIWISIQLIALTVYLSSFTRLLVALFLLYPAALRRPCLEKSTFHVVLLLPFLTDIAPSSY